MRLIVLTLGEIQPPQHLITLTSNPTRLFPRMLLGCWPPKTGDVGGKKSTGNGDLAVSNLQFGIRSSDGLLCGRIE